MGNHAQYDWPSVKLVRFFLLSYINGTISGINIEIPPTGLRVFALGILSDLIE